MRDDTIKKALEIIRKIQDQGIVDNEKLEAIKNKIETSHSITLEEKQYISDNFQKIKGQEKNKTKPLKLKKSHYVAIGAGVAVLMIFVVFDFDMNRFPQLEENIFLVSGLSSTYKTNDICDFGHIFLSGQMVANLPRNQADFQNYYPKEYAVYMKYMGNSYDEQYAHSMLTSGVTTDEIKDATVSLFMKSSSINPNLQLLVKELVYSDSKEKSTIWTYKFLQKLKEEDPLCYAELSGETPTLDVRDIQAKEGEKGLKKGDWVKYQLAVSAEGKFKERMNEMSNLILDSKSGCTYSNYEWTKNEVVEINGNIPIIKTSASCNGQIISEEVGEKPYVLYIPVDVKVGDIVLESKQLGEYKVVGMEKREYGNQIFDVVKVSLEKTATDGNGNSASTSVTSYYEKLSGMLLEVNTLLEINEPSGASSITTVIKAIDINLPRDSNSSDGLGNLENTLEYLGNTALGYLENTFKGDNHQIQNQVTEQSSQLQNQEGYNPPQTSSEPLITNQELQHEEKTPNPEVLSTDKGTLKVRITTIPDQPVAGWEDIKFQIDFINPMTEKNQEHVDYKFTIKSEYGKEVYGPTDLIHTSEGSVTIPIGNGFGNTHRASHPAGTYTGLIEIEGILFKPIPVEVVSFSIPILSPFNAPPEAGRPTGAGILGDEHAHASISYVLDDKKRDIYRADEAQSSWINFEAQDGNTIHRNASGVTLGFMFKTLDYSLNDSCFGSDGYQFCNGNQKLPELSNHTLKYYINHHRVSSIHDYVIQDGDRILISYGNESEDQINSQLAELDSQPILGTSEAPKEALPLKIELEDISILEVNEKTATIEIQFKVTNPNYKAVILQAIKYELYENNVKVKTSQIGERAMEMVDSSDYFTILNDQPTILRDTITIKNTGNSPEFWNALTNITPQWKIKGEASFNLRSITAGGEKEITFEFP